MSLPVVAPVLGVLGLLMAFAVYLYVVAQPAGSGPMIEIADAIESGAMTFLRKEYSILVWFIVVVAVLLSFGIGSRTALAFISGAICSMLAGFVGMKAATKANVRTAQAARFHFEQVVASAAGGIDPFADRIAAEVRLRVLGKLAPVGENAARIVDVVHQEMGRLRRDDDRSRYCPPARRP